MQKYAVDMGKIDGMYRVQIHKFIRMPSWTVGKCPECFWIIIYINQIIDLWNLSQVNNVKQLLIILPLAVRYDIK